MLNNKSYTILGKEYTEKEIQYTEKKIVICNKWDDTIFINI